jgi:DNA-binding CsgD family transcriptional regulator
MTREQSRVEIATAYLPRFPLSEELWRKVADSLRLCERHAKIVELMLRDASDDEIAVIMGIKKATVKTLLGRIRERTQARTRGQLALRVLGIVAELLSRCPSKDGRSCE